MHLHKELGIFFQRARLNQGISQKEVATKIGYGTCQFVSNCERGLSKFPQNTLRTLIGLYKLDPDEVLNKYMEIERKKLTEAIFKKETELTQAVMGAND